MAVMRFSHKAEELEFLGKKYKATCAVRNELNKWRKPNEIVETMPMVGAGSPYYPRSFPTGVWEVGTPEYTEAPAFAPVKIPTNAARRVLLQNVVGGEYAGENGETHMDQAYHLHYAADTNTTLGCIRLDSAEDAMNIAKKVILELCRGKVWLEVVL